MSRKANIIAAKTSIRVSRIKLSDPGCIIINTPKKPIIVTNQRCHVTFSFKKNMAKTNTKREIEKLIIVAVVSGTNVIP